MKKRRAKSVSVRVSANSPTFSSRGIVLTPRSTTVNETTDLSPRQKIVQFRPKAPPTPPPKKQTKILPALQHRSHFELLRTSSLPKPLTSRSSEKKFTVVASPHAVFSKITRKEKAKKIEKISHMCIFSAGDNTFSRLGIGTKLKQDINNIKVPLGQIEFAACGWDHTVIIVGDSVAVCGRASHGQLGNGVTDDLAQLEVVHHIEVTGKKFRSMACGAYYTMLVTEENVLLAAGDNSSGQLGIGNRQKRLSFYRVEFSLPIREVVCGHAHTGIVTKLDGGQLFMTGANYAGQLLLGDKEDRLVFEKVTFFNDLRVKQVALGKEHSVVLTSNGNVYSCGSSAQGQTGLDTFSESILEIQKVNISNVYRVYAGQVHSVFYTNDQEMFVCGSNKSGQLGLGEIERTAVPIEVPFFAGREVVTVAVNHAEHTLVLLADGIIWAAGANEMNQLGLEPNLFEDRVPFFQPVESYLFFNQDMLYVASGPFHSLFISERK